MSHDIPQDVAEVFDSYNTAARNVLLATRALILETALEHPEVGPITETLKWGQPSYLTEVTRSGSTIRLGSQKGDPNQPLLFVHCQTSLVEEFRQLAEDELDFIGNRAVKLDAVDVGKSGALRQCISSALTYHSRKRR